MKYFIIFIVGVILISGFLIYQGIYLPVDSNSEETITFLVKKALNSLNKKYEYSR